MAKDKRLQKAYENVDTGPSRIRWRTRSSW